LVYNLVAVASLVFVYRLTPQGHEIALWEWNGPFRVVQFSLWAIAALIFYESFRLLDVVRFLGLRSPRRARSLANGGSGLVTTCIYGVLRHPQFAAGLIALWSRDLTDTGLVINVVLSLYLIIGAHIEESRLLARYGEAYARYMREVPRFIPRLRSRWRSVAR
jgi:protein-S-isoprenylcysteine O-methyltransferase Ste14